MKKFFMVEFYMNVMYEEEKYVSSYTATTTKIDDEFISMMVYRMINSFCDLEINDVYDIIESNVFSMRYIEVPEEGQDIFHFQSDIDGVALEYAQHIEHKFLKIIGGDSPNIVEKDYVWGIK